MLIRSRLSLLLSIVLIATILLFIPAEVHCSEEDHSELLWLFQQALSAPETESEGIQYDLGVYLVEDPATFIHLLSLESKEVQDAVVQHMIWEAEWYYECNIPGFMEGVYSVQLGEDENEAAHEILRTLEAAVEEIWGIPNPKTGDPVGIVMAAMAVCGFGGAVLLKRRKKNEFDM